MIPLLIPAALGLIGGYLSKEPKKYHLGGNMSKHLAPNGKPSNLTHKQWHLVRTAEFKAWFGDWEQDRKNKFLDENGEPKVFYHFGENKWNKINVKTISKMGDTVSGRMFLAPEKEDVYFTDIQSKIKFEKDNKATTRFIDDVAKKFIRREFFIKGDSKKLSFDNRYKKTLSDKYNYIVQYPESILKSAKSMYKYVYKRNKKFDNYYIIVTNSSNIKLADGTNTTFDENPDIRYAEGGNINRNIPYNIYREFNEYSDKLPEFGYHGTQSNTLINPRPSKDGRYGEGFYLTLDPETAEYFGKFGKGIYGGYTEKYETANVFEFDLRGLNLKYYKSSDDMPYIDFDELNKRNYDGIYLYNEGEIVIFNTNKLNARLIDKDVWKFYKKIGATEDGSPINKNSYSAELSKSALNQYLNKGKTK
jgi:hypothetical protein